MLWGDFLAGLDTVRTNLRSRGPAYLKEEADLRDTHPDIKLLYSLLSGNKLTSAAAAPIVLPPNPPPPPRAKEKPQRMAAGSYENGAMTVFPREGGYVPGKQPVLEEITEEDAGE